MAAGVGKTYRMLLEGHAELENGRDVVIGLLETHGRKDTATLAEGLPQILRRTVTYRDTTLEEMDLPAILTRRPELCLIDELAHTNAPGVEHAKRYEDVEDVLAAGIDVLSTLNVQHLESLNDQIAELSGVRVRETIPDAILGRADEVVLVDLTPEALLDRLRAGKVYRPERIDAALNGFFRIENLSALREVALRQVAAGGRPKRLATVEPVGTRETSIAGETPQAVGERLLALVEPYPGAQRLVRRAWRSAQRLGAPLDLLWIRPPGHRPLRRAGALAARAAHLGSVLGAQLLVEESDTLARGDRATSPADAARRTSCSAAAAPRGLARLRTPTAAAADGTASRASTCGSSPTAAAEPTSGSA